MDLDILWFILLGLVAGLTGGLLGIGGGSVTLPLLYFLLKNKGLPYEELMQIVIGTTFAAMCLNAFVSFITHHFLGNVRWKVLFSMLPGVILGPIIGAFISVHLTGDILRYAFGFFQCALAVYLLWPSKPEEPVGHHPPPIILNIAGLFIGIIGSILGIGGGVLMIPLLIFLRFPLKKSIGTSAASTFVMIGLATLCYYFFGLAEEPTIREQAGFIYVPAFIAIGMSSVIGAPIGAYCTKFLHTDHLKKVFAVVQAALGISLIVFS